MNLLLLMPSLAFADYDFTPVGGEWNQNHWLNDKDAILLRKPVTVGITTKNEFHEEGWLYCDDVEDWKQKDHCVTAIRVGKRCKSYVAKQTQCIKNALKLEEDDQSWSGHGRSASHQRKIDACTKSCGTIDACNMRYNQGTKARRNCQQRVRDCISRCRKKYTLQVYCTSPAYDACAWKAVEQNDKEDAQAELRKEEEAKQKVIAEEKKQAAIKQPSLYKGTSLEIMFIGKSAGTYAQLDCDGKRKREKVVTTCLEKKQYSSECKTEQTKVVFFDTPTSYKRCSLRLSPSNIRSSIKLAKRLYCDVKGSYMNCSDTKEKPKPKTKPTPSKNGLKNPWE